MNFIIFIYPSQAWISRAWIPQRQVKMDMGPEFHHIQYNYFIQVKLGYLLNYCISQRPLNTMLDTIKNTSFSFIFYPIFNRYPIPLFYPSQAWIK